MSNERDDRISAIFYHFAKDTNVEIGRAVGRKIGVLQEIIVRKLLLQSERLNDAVIFEPYLRGISGASHKVEFVFFQPVEAIEFNIGDSQRVGGLELKLTAVKSSQAKFALSSNGIKKRTLSFPVHYILNKKNATELLRSVGDGIGLKLSAVNEQEGKARVSVLNVQVVRASVESKRVGAQRFARSEQLGAGIQSIEKAKQTALVAIDADLLFNRTTKALTMIEAMVEAKAAGDIQGATDTEDEAMAEDGVAEEVQDAARAEYEETSKASAPREYVSVVVLGNGVHWTEKDKNILRTYVDYTFQVKDETIIRYAKYVRSLAEREGKDFLPYFMTYFKGMTKTAPDDFAVGENDFIVICPEKEKRSLSRILDEQVKPYLSRRSSSSPSPSS